MWKQIAWVGGMMTPVINAPPRSGLKKRAWLVPACWLGFVLLFCFAPALLATAALPQPDQRLVYKRLGEVELRLHLFLPASDAAPVPRPAIVFFPGGGWLRAVPAQFFRHARHFADRGMVAMVAEYRVAEQHGATPKQALQDANSAIRWLRSNASALNVDPHRIVAAGGSAGGQLAAATGIVSAFDEPGDDLSVSSRPDALLLFGATLDNGPGNYGHERVQAYWREFSPLQNISPEAPPAILLHGTADRLMPAVLAKAFQRKMQDNGVRCELSLFAGAPHGFFNGKYFQASLMKADDFLVSLGYIKPRLP